MFDMFGKVFTRLVNVDNCAILITISYVKRYIAYTTF